jgi:cyclophilin family peptidyl-prolyl cis-trans isomerase
MFKKAPFDSRRFQQVLKKRYFLTFPFDRVAKSFD